MESMESFIKQDNLSLLRRRLANPRLSDKSRKLLLKLIAEENAKELFSKRNDRAHDLRSS
jgi:hypothetical protein